MNTTQPITDLAFVHVDEIEDNYAILCSEDGLDIATLHRVRLGDACLSDKGWQATVNLIAAAPEMLEALQRIDSNAAESVEWIRRVAREAIAKATQQS